MIGEASTGLVPQPRIRRTRAELAALEHALVQLVQAQQPMTVRQVFYQAVSHRLIDKSERAYKAVCRLLGNLRRAERLPYAWIADNTRWMRKPESFTSIAGALRETAACYRRALWADQRAYVEVWLEKDALSGVVYDVTAAWDVPLMVTRGYPSLSFLHGAAQHIRAHRKPAFLYYLGDLDPSGVDIPRHVEAQLRRLAPDVPITFQLLAVTRAHVAQYDLLTRPTKRTDSRSRRFEGDSVEVDALPPAVLRQFVAAAIEAHLDQGVLAGVQAAEASEREALAWLARDWSATA